MSNTNHAPERRRGTRGWVEPEDYEPGPLNIWFILALLFWSIGIAAGFFGIWALAATGIITGTIAGVRSR